MPQNITHQLPVTDVRRGDVMVDGDDTQHRVVARKSAIKWTVVEYDDGSKVRRLNSESVTIIREEATPEELKAEDRERSVRFVTARLNEQLAISVSAELRKIADRHDADVAAGKYSENIDLLDWANTPGILKLQAERKPWLEVQRTLESLINVGVPDADVVTAVAVYVAESDRRRYPTDPTSRSTSVLSNLFADLDTWARDTFLDRIRFYVSEELLADEIARVHAFHDNH